MHEPVGQFAVRGKNQQPAGVVVQPADGNPLGGSQLRQFIEYRNAASGIVTTDDFPFRLVIQHDARQTRSGSEVNDALADTHRILRGNAITELCYLAIDGYLSSRDQ